MHRFKNLVTYGDYEFHTINRAENIETGQEVILQIMKKQFYSWEEIMNFKQIQVMRLLNNPYILKLKEIIQNKDDLICVYENYNENLFEWYQTIRDGGKTVSESLIKNIILQIANGLSYVHQVGFFHRDLSLESVFISDNQNIRLGNFSCAREIQARPPLTDYITTRWYRAPQQLIHSTNYTTQIDSWALGCIMAELFLLGPIFGGVSEIDQLFRILKILGCPNYNDWPEFFLFLENIMKDKSKELREIQEIKPKGLCSLITNASKEAIDLLNQLLTMNPNKRISISAVIKHPFFNTNSSVQNILLSENINTNDFEEFKSNSPKQEKDKSEIVSKSNDLESDNRQPTKDENLKEQQTEFKIQLNIEPVQPIQKEFKSPSQSTIEKVMESKSISNNEMRIQQNHPLDNKDQKSVAKIEDNFVSNPNSSTTNARVQNTNSKGIKNLNLTGLNNYNDQEMYSNSKTSSNGNGLNSNNNTANGSGGSINNNHNYSESQGASILSNNKRQSNDNIDVHTKTNVESSKFKPSDQNNELKNSENHQTQLADEGLQSQQQEVRFSISNTNQNDFKKKSLQNEQKQIEFDKINHNAEEESHVQQSHPQPLIGVPVMSLQFGKQNVLKQFRSNNSNEEN